MLFVGAILCVSLTSLAAGIVWRQWMDDAQVPGLHVDQLRQFENHWKVLNSGPVRVDDWADKIVLLNFWGSWCPPCIEEMPLLDQFNADNDAIQIVGIVVDEEQAAASFLAQYEISFPSLLFNQSSVTDLLVSMENTELVLPYSVAYDRSGELFFTRAGPLSEQDLQSLVD